MRMKTLFSGFFHVFIIQFGFYAEQRKRERDFCFFLFRTPKLNWLNNFQHKSCWDSTKCFRLNIRYWVREKEKVSEPHFHNFVCKSFLFPHSMSVYEYFCILFFHTRLSSCYSRFYATNKFHLFFLTNKRQLLPWLIIKCDSSLIH